MLATYDSLFNSDMTEHTHIQQAITRILEPAELNLTHIDQVFSRLMHHDVDYADLYFESTAYESWYLDDGIVKEGSYEYETGVGVRVNVGEKTAYAYSADLLLPSLLEASQAVSSMATAGKSGIIKPWSSPPQTPLYPPVDPLSSLTVEEKIALLNLANRIGRACDSRIIQVTASLVGVHETVLIFNHEGKQVADIRPLVRFNVTVVAEENGRREAASAGGGARGDYQYLIDQGLVESFTKEAARQALLNLHAVPAPAGLMPVVLGPGWPGVLLHEAIGHGFEGDFIRKKTSAFTNSMGKQIAHPKCTVVDDGTLYGRRGSLTMDDEGTPTQCTTLIENGVVKGFMHDRLSARLLGVTPTGNGRRESYAHVPMPRMTNTYMLPGEDAPEDIIRSVKKGIYAVNFGGGEVDITSGKFVFSANEAYLIEDGKITAPVKGATLIGSGPSVLTKVSMIGHDLSLDSGVGVCGKDGQSVPVGVGQPTIKVDEMVVGGTQV